MKIRKRRMKKKIKSLNRKHNKMALNKRMMKKMRMMMMMVLILKTMVINMAMKRPRILRNLRKKKSRKYS